MSRKSLIFFPLLPSLKGKDCRFGEKEEDYRSFRTHRGRKTDLSLAIADILGGEIISADSMQVYRGMDVGTAKVSQEVQKAIPHHLIDIRNVRERFNVVDFYHEAHKICQEILLRDRVPIVVGGAGFYLHAFLYGPPLGPPSQMDLRERLEKQVEQMGPEVLYERLQMLDPEYAATITEKDRHKIVRALEIMALTEKKVSEIPVSKEKQADLYDFRCWFLFLPKEELYKRVEKRCDDMLQGGLLDEVKKLELLGLRENFSASQAIGYRQSLAFLDSAGTEEDWEMFVSSFKKSSRHYVRKQFTWFRKELLFSLA